MSGMNLKNIIHLKNISISNNEIEFTHFAEGVCGQYLNDSLRIEYEGVELSPANERLQSLATCCWLGSGALLLWLFSF